MFVPHRLPPRITLQFSRYSPPLQLTRTFILSLNLTSALTLILHPLERKCMRDFRNENVFLRCLYDNAPTELIQEFAVPSSLQCHPERQMGIDRVSLWE